MLELQPSSQFKRDYKRAKKQKKDLALLKKIITALAQQKPLAQNYCDHALGGHWQGYRECHISPDWLLIYRIDQEKNTLKLMRLNNHANIFKK